MMIGVLVMLNNYFHDVASALLLCCAVLMMLLLKRVKASGNKDIDVFFIEIYEKICFIAAASLAWILLGGIVRTIAYRSYEWSDAVGRGQVPALIVKHIFFLFLVGAGIHFWLKLRGEVAKIRKENETGKFPVE